MSETEREEFKLDQIKALRRAGVATWNDEKEYHEIRRRRVIRRHRERYL